MLRIELDIRFLLQVPDAIGGQVPPLRGPTMSGVSDPQALGGRGASTSRVEPELPDPFRSLLALARLRGDVALYRAGSESAYLVTRPEFVKRVLLDNSANYDKATFINSMFKAVVADGLLVSEGAAWARQRRLLQPAFDREHAMRIGPNASHATVSMLDRWRGRNRPGETIDIASEMGSLTLQITANALFGVNLSDRSAAIQDMVALCGRSLVSPRVRDFAAAREQIERVVGDVIDTNDADRAPTNDVVTTLLDPGDDDDARFTRTEIRDQLITLLLAGHGTSANALTWTWLLLAKHPDVLAELQREVDRHLGSRIPTVQDLQLLEFTRAVVHESMRLYPPAWIIGRRALRDDRLGDTAISAGSVVAISPGVMHRHPDLWQDPDRFDPTRFLRGPAARRAPFVFMPFGGGPRICIGRHVAMVELCLIVATVVQRCRLTLSEAYRVRPERLFILRPRGGLPMSIEFRRGTPAA